MMLLLDDSQLEFLQRWQAGEIVGRAVGLYRRICNLDTLIRLYDLSRRPYLERD